MVKTIHEHIEDDAHKRLSAWKDHEGMTWREFLHYLADQTPDDVEVAE